MISVCNRTFLRSFKVCKVAWVSVPKSGSGHSRHHAIPARPLRLKSGHQTRGQSRLVAFESVEEQPRTTAGRHPGWRGAPGATTRLSSMRISRSISPSSSAIFRSRWANGNGVFAIRLISANQPFSQHVRLNEGQQCVPPRRAVRSVVSLADRSLTNVSPARGRRP